LGDYQQYQKWLRGGRSAGGVRKNAERYRFRSEVDTDAFYGMYDRGYKIIVDESDPTPDESERSKRASAGTEGKSKKKAGASFAEVDAGPDQQ
ncbi:unnamed protein product, partial [Amoebophrya sp. A120]